MFPSPSRREAARRLASERSRCRTSRACRPNGARRENFRNGGEDGRGLGERTITQGQTKWTGIRNGSEWGSKGG